MYQADQLGRRGTDPSAQSRSERRMKLRTMAAQASESVGPVPTRSVLELRDVRKEYSGTPAVNGVSLSVSHGEFVTLLGPSGSGKSTIISLVAGFMEPTAGDIRYEGRSVTQIPPHRRHIGVVFQNYALFPHMTAAENLQFPLKMRGIRGRAARAKVDAALELVDLSAEASKYPKEMSGGQQQRIALARALVFEPKLLLMDEPLSSLDRRLRERLQADIVRVQKTLDIAVVYVTHDQDEAFIMSDRIGVINRGELIQLGTGEELFDTPQTVFVANFIGDSNLVRGRLDRSARQLVVASTGARLPVRIEMAERLRSPDSSDVVLMIRPGRVHLHARGQAPGGRVCALDGILASATYVSGAMRYRAEVPSLASVVDCFVDAHRDHERFVPGDPITASWAITDAVLVDDDVRSNPDTSTS